MSNPKALARMANRTANAPAADDSESSTAQTMDRRGLIDVPVADSRPQTDYSRNEFRE